MVGAFRTLPLRHPLEGFSTIDPVQQLQPGVEDGVFAFGTLNGDVLSGAGDYYLHIGWGKPSIQHVGMLTGDVVDDTVPTGVGDATAQAADNVLRRLQGFGHIQFAEAVNVLIKQGIQRANRLFSLDSLKAVKYFYNTLSKDNKVKQVFNKLDIQNRAKRCAAQYAYFAIREYKRRVNDIQLLCPIIAKEIRQKGLTSIHFHNQYLMIIVQTGLLGLSLLLALMVQYYRLPIDHKELKELATLFITIFAISFIAEPLWQKQFTIALFILFTGLLINASLSGDKDKYKQPKRISV